jgi:hypothetical protein
MNKKVIDEIRAEMIKINAPGSCECCPITIYRHLSIGIGCAAHWEQLCERLDIKYSGGIGCTDFYEAFMDMKIGRFCRI